MKRALGAGMAIVVFAHCVPLPFDPLQLLGVQVSTTGSMVDPDGYVVIVDGSLVRNVATNGSISFEGLTAGQHTVELSGLAANCWVAAGTNPQTVVLSGQADAQVTFAVACAESNGAGPGALVVQTSTTGEPPDPDGYTITVDGTVSQTVATNGTIVFADLSAGAHIVSLGGLASNCTLVGANGITVTVSQQVVTQTTFAVSCAPSQSGSWLLVHANTTGDAPDPDGYTVTVDGGDARPLASDGSVVFESLSVGQHMVALSGVAANCTVAGANPRNVSVALGTVVQEVFVITCETPPPGSLIVQATTTGTGVDADGYTVAVDGAAALAIASSGSVLFEGLAAGEHSVQLSGVAANCMVEGSNPQTVTTVSGSATQAAFVLTCSGTGSLLVQAVTTGSSADTDGYTVTVDDTEMQPVATNGAVSFEELPAGAHTVSLSGLASSCSVSGPNPQAVTVGADALTQTTFGVLCVSGGELLVQATTTGSSVDPDGYTVTVNGTVMQSVATNGAVAFEGLEPGAHAVSLSGVAANCSVSGPNPRAVTVAADALERTTFEVSCVGTGSLLVQATTTGSGVDPDGYTITVDGNATSEKPVGPNSSVVFEGLAAGGHTVSLNGVAANCTVGGDNPQAVVVAPESVVQATFSITCEGAGSLLVQATTVGVGIDPDGYLVTVDGLPGSMQAVGSSGSVLFEGLDAGTHTVALSGIAPNCSVTDPNPRTIAVVDETLVQVTFVVECVSVSTASIVVGTSTNGCNPATDTYTVTLDGEVSQTIGRNDSVLFPGLSSGTHIVLLAGVGGNCALYGDNPQTVWVEADAATHVSFDIRCRYGDPEGGPTPTPVPATAESPLQENSGSSC